MNWVDFFIGVVVILTIAIGYKRGLFKEITTLFGMILSAIVALNYANWVAIKAEGWFSISPSLRYVLGFVVCFALCLLFLKLVGYYFYKMVKLSQLGATDKIGGIIFGAFKGAVVLSLIFLMFIFFPAFSSFNLAIDNSTMAPYIRQIIPVAFNITGHFHPNSGKFVEKSSAGVLGSNALEYSDNPESLIGKEEARGFSLDDVRVLDNLDRYFGDRVEVATKDEDSPKEKDDPEEE